jgi:hypothetical protein
MNIPCLWCRFYSNRYRYCTLFKGMVYINTSSVTAEFGCPYGVSIWE